MGNSKMMQAKAHEVPTMVETPAPANSSYIHPVEFIQENYEKNREELKMQMVRSTFGTHMVNRIKTDEAIFSQFRRLPTLPSSFVALDTLKGADEGLEFEDILGDPSETFAPVSLTLDQRLGKKTSITL